jgi:hypothetical protein
VLAYTLLLPVDVVVFVGALWDSVVPLRVVVTRVILRIATSWSQLVGPMTVIWRLLQGKIVMLMLTTGCWVLGVMKPLLGWLVRVHPAHYSQNRAG